LIGSIVWAHQKLRKPKKICRQHKRL
jgi:hypothetical protein